MSDARSLEIPDEADLIAFFGAEPIERSTENGFWCFAVEDEHGIKLRLSFNLFERSVQTELSVGGVVVETVSHELADRLQVNGLELEARFTVGDSSTRLVIRLIPSITVRWSALRTR